MKDSLFICLVIFFVTVSILFNKYAIDIRYDQAEYLFGMAAIDYDQTRTTTIAGKFELMKQTLYQRQQSLSNYELEASIQTIMFSDVESEIVERSGWYSISHVPVQAIIEIINRVLGKSIVVQTNYKEFVRHVEKGFMWERARKYHEAIASYDSILSLQALSQSVNSSILLHRAFCNAMLNRYSNSFADLELLTKNHSETDAAVIGKKLYTYLQSLSYKQKMVENEQLSTFDKAIKYFELMDYVTASTLFEQLCDTLSDRDYFQEALVYLARCSEAIGNSEESILLYKKALSLNPKSTWATFCLRRLYMIHTYYDHKPNLSIKLQQCLVYNQDNKFVETMTQFLPLLKQDQKKKADTQADNRDSVYENSLASLSPHDFLKQYIGPDYENSIDEESRKPVQQDDKKLPRTEVPIRDLQSVAHRSVLHQYRSPDYIKRIINQNSLQLRLLYNKLLRKESTVGGTLQVQMIIKTNGSINQTAIISSSIPNIQFQQEVIAVINKWRFPQIDDSFGDITIKYPFEFIPDTTTFKVQH